MMSKISFYDVSFPYDFNKISSKIELEGSKNEIEFIKVIKKRPSYFECKFTFKDIYTEEYFDINNNIKSLEKLRIDNINFRIYNLKYNNLIIFDQPRSILKLRNFLSKLFNFEFSLTKKSLNLDLFLKNNLHLISHISRIDAREIIHPNKIFEQKVLYTQNFDTNLIDFFKSNLTTNSFKIFKIELFLKKFPSAKIIISYDFKIIFTKVDHEDLLNFFFDFEKYELNTVNFE